MDNNGKVHTPTSSILPQELGTFNPDELGSKCTCFSVTRTVRIIATRSLPCMLAAGAAALVTTLVLPAAPFVLALVATGYIVVGATTSSVLSYKALSDRKMELASEIPCFLHPHTPSKSGITEPTQSRTGHKAPFSSAKKQPYQPGKTDPVPAGKAEPVPPRKTTPVPPKKTQPEPYPEPLPQPFIPGYSVPSIPQSTIDPIRLSPSVISQQSEIPEVPDIPIPPLPMGGGAISQNSSNSDHSSFRSDLSFDDSQTSVLQPAGFHSLPAQFRFPEDSQNSIDLNLPSDRRNGSQRHDRSSNAQFPSASGENRRSLDPRQEQRNSRRPEVNHSDASLTPLSQSIHFPTGASVNTVPQSSLIPAGANRDILNHHPENPISSAHQIPRTTALSFSSSTLSDGNDSQYDSESGTETSDDEDGENSTLRRQQNGIHRLVASDSGQRIIQPGLPADGSQRHNSHSDGHKSPSASRKDHHVSDSMRAARNSKTLKVSRSSASSVPLDPSIHSSMSASVRTGSQSSLTQADANQAAMNHRTWHPVSTSQTPKPVIRLPAASTLPGGKKSPCYPAAVAETDGEQGSRNSTPKGQVDVTISAFPRQFVHEIINQSVFELDQEQEGRQNSSIFPVRSDMPVLDQLISEDSVSTTHSSYVSLANEPSHSDSNSEFSESESEGSVDEQFLDAMADLPDSEQRAAHVNPETIAVKDLSNDQTKNSSLLNRTDGSDVRSGMPFLDQLISEDSVSTTDSSYVSYAPELSVSDSNSEVSESESEGSVDEPFLDAMEDLSDSEQQAAHVNPKTIAVKDLSNDQTKDSSLLNRIGGSDVTGSSVHSNRAPDSQDTSKIDDVTWDDTTQPIQLRGKFKDRNNSLSNDDQSLLTSLTSKLLWSSKVQFQTSINAQNISSLSSLDVIQPESRRNTSILNDPESVSVVFDNEWSLAQSSVLSDKAASIKFDNTDLTTNPQRLVKHASESGPSDLSTSSSLRMTSLDPATRNSGHLNLDETNCLTCRVNVEIYGKDIHIVLNNHNQDPQDQALRAMHRNPTQVLLRTEILPSRAIAGRAAEEQGMVNLRLTLLTHNTVENPDRPIVLATIKTAIPSAQLDTLERQFLANCALRLVFSQDELPAFNWKHCALQSGNETTLLNAQGIDLLAIEQPEYGADTKKSPTRLPSNANFATTSSTDVFDRISTHLDMSDVPQERTNADTQHKTHDFNESTTLKPHSNPDFKLPTPMSAADEGEDEDEVAEYNSAAGISLDFGPPGLGLPPAGNILTPNLTREQNNTDQAARRSYNSANLNTQGLPNDRRPQSLVSQQVTYEDLDALGPAPVPPNVTPFQQHLNVKPTGTEQNQADDLVKIETVLDSNNSQHYDVIHPSLNDSQKPSISDVPLDTPKGSSGSPCPQVISNNTNVALPTRRPSYAQVQGQWIDEAIDELTKILLLCDKFYEQSAAHEDAKDIVKQAETNYNNKYVETNYNNKQGEKKSKWALLKDKAAHLKARTAQFVGLQSTVMDESQKRQKFHAEVADAVMKRHKIQLRYSYFTEPTVMEPNRVKYLYHLETKQSLRAPYQDNNGHVKPERPRRPLPKLPNTLKMSQETVEQQNQTDDGYEVPTKTKNKSNNDLSLAEHNHPFNTNSDEQYKTTNEDPIYESIEPVNKTKVPFITQSALPRVLTQSHNATLLSKTSTHSLDQSYEIVPKVIDPADQALYTAFKAAPLFSETTARTNTVMQGQLKGAVQTTESHIRTPPAKQTLKQIKEQLILDIRRSPYQIQLNIDNITVFERKTLPSMDDNLFPELCNQLIEELEQTLKVVGIQEQKEDKPLLQILASECHQGGFVASYQIVVGVTNCAVQEVLARHVLDDAHGFVDLETVNNDSSVQQRYRRTYIANHLSIGSNFGINFELDTTKKELTILKTFKTSITPNLEAEAPEKYAKPVTIEIKSVLKLNDPSTSHIQRIVIMEPGDTTTPNGADSLSNTLVLYDKSQH